MQRRGYHGTDRERASMRHAADSENENCTVANSVDLAETGQLFGAFSWRDKIHRASSGLHEKSCTHRLLSGEAGDGRRIDWGRLAEGAIKNETPYRCSFPCSAAVVGFLCPFPMKKYSFRRIILKRWMRIFLVKWTNEVQVDFQRDRNFWRLALRYWCLNMFMVFHLIRMVDPLCSASSIFVS